MFIDKVRTTLFAGKGGNGTIKFDMQKRPMGGDGGSGGNVYIKGSTNLKDLRAYTGGLKFRATQGDSGGRNKATGSKGEDVVLEVPVGTVVFDGDKEILVITEPKKYLIAKGGKGGKGNHAFRTGGLINRDTFTPGTEGEKIEATFELRLTADIVFIGFPNAGKSSMLNALTNANVKVAAYPFTTLEPHLGKAENGVRLMDLPGLIEGTVEGKGLGTRFTKHAEQGHLVAHFISLESEDIESDYKKMRKEIADISPILEAKPELIVLTKKDLFDEEFVAEKVKKMKKYGNVIATSAYDWDGLKQVAAELYERLKEVMD